MMAHYTNYNLNNIEFYLIYSTTVFLLLNPNRFFFDY